MGNDTQQDGYGYAEPVLDFDSDAPLPVCPLRNNGDEVCESCQ
jgi:hypothetical protein